MSRDPLAPFATRDLLDVVRFAQRLEHDDIFTLRDAPAWQLRRLAWRWQLRHPVPVRADAALDPHYALCLCVSVATQLEPAWIS